MTDIVAPPEIDELPPAPDRGDPAAQFSADAAAFTGALPQLGTQMNASAAATYQNAAAAVEAAGAVQAVADVAMGNTDLVGFSTSNLSVSAGVKTVHLTEPVEGFALNDQVLIRLRSDNSIQMAGQITLWDGSDDMQVTVVTSGVFGSGVYASWIVMSGAFLQAGATAADIHAGETDRAAITPKGWKDSLEAFELVDAATVAPSTADGFRFYWLVGGNNMLDAVEETYVGAPIHITFEQEAPGGYDLAFDGSWESMTGQMGVLAQGSGALTELVGEVMEVDVGGTATRTVYNMGRPA
jgi:hypothetical protein